jgi:hypothetical protein
MRRKYQIECALTVDAEVVDRIPDPLSRRYWRSSAATTAADLANRSPEVAQIINDLYRALGRRPTFPEARWYAYDTRTGKEVVS